MAAITALKAEVESMRLLYPCEIKKLRAEGYTIKKGAVALPFGGRIDTAEVMNPVGTGYHRVCIAVTK